MDTLRQLRYRKSANLLRAPLHPDDPASDRVFALVEARDRGGRLDLNAPDWAPTIALDADAQRRFAPDSPTSHSFFAGQGCPGLFSLSAGLLLWVAHPETDTERLLLLERDAGAPVYPGHLTEPAGRCGESPLLTMAREPVEELLLVACGRDPETGRPVQRPLLPVASYSDALDAQLWRTHADKVRARADALQAAGLDPSACAHAEPLLVGLRPRLADAQHHRRVVVSAAGRPLADFPALAWVLPEERCVELRRSAVLDLPSWVDRLVALDGERFGRPVRRMTFRQLGSSAVPLIPSLRAYRRLVCQPRLAVIEPDTGARDRREQPA